MKILLALILKEAKQIIRDPSSIVIAFVLPLISFLIYMYGVNLDAVKVTVGIKNDDGSVEVAGLVNSFGNSQYVNSLEYGSMDALKDAILSSKIKGALVIPNDFSDNLSKGKTAQILIITDGSEVNTANYVQNYALSITEQWLSQSKYQGKITKKFITIDSRTWYNPELNSHNFIVPGSIAITMTLIGILLTSLVIAREWERGTMESLLSTPVRPIHIVLGKYISYFILGMLSMGFNVFLCTVVFQIPFRGSYILLFLISSIFLFTSLGIGLLISSFFKNQFMASMVAMSTGFMPALILSGLLFPINSMPVFFQYLTALLPPRYYISFIESEFMSGGVNEIRISNAFYLSVLGLILFIAVYRKTQTRLEK